MTRVSTTCAGSSPRAWGASLETLALSFGSSPRAWGAFGLAIQITLRFIPTCVGSMRSGRPVLPSVHPHVRGEHRTGVPAFERAVGSSPRAWHQVESDNWAFMKTVHPHMRGEHNFRIQNRKNGRFIPTCVGSMTTWSKHGSIPTCMERTMTRTSNNFSDHPHVHGNEIGGGYSGSSPRAWGACGHPRRGLFLGGSSPRAWGALARGRSC